MTGAKRRLARPSRDQAASGGRECTVNTALDTNGSAPAAPGWFRLSACCVGNSGERETEGDGVAPCAIMWHGTPGALPPSLMPPPSPQVVVRKRIEELAKPHMVTVKKTAGSATATVTRVSAAGQQCGLLPEQRLADGVCYWHSDRCLAPSCGLQKARMAGKLTAALKPGEDG